MTHRASVNRSTVAYSPLQSTSAPASHAGGRWFDPSRAHCSIDAGLPVMAALPLLGGYAK